MQITCSCIEKKCAFTILFGIRDIGFVRFAEFKFHAVKPEYRRPSSRINGYVVYRFSECRQYRFVKIYARFFPRSRLQSGRDIFQTMVDIPCYKARYYVCKSERRTFSYKPSTINSMVRLEVSLPHVCSMSTTCPTAFLSSLT